MTPLDPSLTQARLGRTLDVLVDDLELPGISVACTLPGGERFRFNHGCRADAPGEPIDNDSIFAVASVTKSFTALAVVILAESGALGLDDPLAHWLPGLALPGGAEEEATIRHLLSHTSGLPGLPLIHGARTPSILRDPDRGTLADRAPIAEDWKWIRNVEDLISALSEGGYSLLGAPGTVFNYSNEGFGLLQGIIEAVSGMTYSELLTAEVFAPAGIDRFGFTTEDIGVLDNIVPLFAPKTGAAERYSPSPAWWDVGDIYANGSLKISSEALLAIVDRLRASALADSQLPGFSRRGYRMLTDVEADLPDGGRYGLGLELSPPSEKHRWFGHGGSIKGASTLFRAYPDDGLSVVCLINASDAPVSRVVETIVRDVLGTEVPAHPQRECVSDPDGGEHIGLYTSGELNEIEVASEAGKLFVRKNSGVRTPIVEIDTDSFITPGGQRHVFLRSGTGTITALFTSKRVHGKQSLSPAGESETTTAVGGWNSEQSANRETAAGTGASDDNGKGDPA
ncbi:serine hydrolase domain-containing protein [Brevibacterium sp.]|uniref:serine hydrolase domain-containing protein n=1 Tax=Brevibacterium sp. TaxID=1701 RepID=UPI0025B8F620|nr:serine hydrolase domain-containing protein [Brevibacterium sp.]